LACTPQVNPLSSPKVTAMPIKVVDASALAALLFGEPEAEAVASQLGDARLVAPALLDFQLANVCLIKSRRQSDQHRALTAAFRLRHRLALEKVAVDHDAALQLAGETGLTAYDASYLWLSRHFGAELVTLDQRLATTKLA
jgi:predicted nucleic acid-binding protein